MNADELAEFLVNGGAWRLALEQREEFQRETERQEREAAERARRQALAPAGEGKVTTTGRGSSAVPRPGMRGARGGGGKHPTRGFSEARPDLWQFR